MNESSEKYIPTEEQIQMQEDFFSENKEAQKKIIEEECEEAYFLNAALDHFQETRKALAVNEIEQGRFPNDLFIERQLEIARRIEEKEKDPETKENFELAVASIKEAFPEYAGRLGLKDMLHFISAEEFRAMLAPDDEKVRPAAANVPIRLVYFIEDFLKESEGHHSVHALDHEFLHMISFRKGRLDSGAKDNHLHYHISTGIEEAELNLQRTTENKTIVLSQTLKDEQLNEFLTDYFAAEALMRYAEKHADKKDKIQDILEKSNVLPIHEVIKKIGEKVGYEILEKAYFEGGKERLVDRFGQESFEEFSNLLEEAIAKEDDEAGVKLLDFLDKF